MDINVVVLSGRVFDMGYNPRKDPRQYGVAEGKLMVGMGKREDGKEAFEEFNIRAYGKKSKFISELRNGTFVTINGRAREDIRINASNPETSRSKTYIDIQTIAVEGVMRE